MFLSQMRVWIDQILVVMQLLKAQSFSCECVWGASLLLLLYYYSYTVAAATKKKIGGGYITR